MLIVLRDDVEAALRAWNAYELGRGAPPVIDFDCYPQTAGDVQPCDRLATFRKLQGLRQAADGELDQATLVERIDAHLAYLRALMGEHSPLDAYVLATQGCHAYGWPEPYIQQVGEKAKEHLEAIGIPWGRQTRTRLAELEQKIDAEDAPAAIEQAAHELEPAVRRLVHTDAPFHLSIQAVNNVNAYWGYWTDGAGPDVRVQLNMKYADFTKVLVRQFALHEVLGHGLQSASYAQRCQTDETVPWVRLMSVHAQHQVLLEGLAQALPLFVTPDDTQLVTRVRLDHYTQLVRSTLHIALAAGNPVESCVQYAKSHVPYWDDEDIADSLGDRGTNPLLRSYLWAYPAGIDWFVRLADAKSTHSDTVLTAAYQDPLTPADLSRLWPQGPPVGGPGHEPGLDPKGSTG